MLLVIVVVLLVLLRLVLLVLVRLGPLALVLGLVVGGLALGVHLVLLLELNYYYDSTANRRATITRANTLGSWTVPRFSAAAS